MDSNLFIVFSLPGGVGGGEDLGAGPHPGETGCEGSGVFAEIAPLLHPVAAHSLLQLLHVGDGEVPLLQPGPVQLVVAGLLPLVSVVSEIVEISEHSAQSPGDVSLTPPGRVGEELQADLAVLTQLVCR